MEEFFSCLENHWVTALICLVSIILLVLMVIFANRKKKIISLAAIVPYIIGNSIAKTEVNQIVDKKFEDLAKVYSTSLFSLRKQNAHSKRMIASLLNDVNRSNGKDKMWAIGWASEALISYCQIKDIYKNEEYIHECIEIIHENANKDSTGDDNEVNTRTLKSLLTMHAYLLLKGNDFYKHLTTEGFNLCALEAMLMGKLDYHDAKWLKKFLKSCKLSDLNDEEDNLKIISKVEEIFNDDIKSELEK